MVYFWWFFGRKSTILAYQWSTGGGVPPPGGRPGGWGPKRAMAKIQILAFFDQSRSLRSLGDDPLRGTPPSRDLYRGPPTGPNPFETDQLSPLLVLPLSGCFRHPAPGRDFLPGLEVVPQKSRAAPLEIHLREYPDPPIYPVTHVVACFSAVQKSLTRLWQPCTSAIYIIYRGGRGGGVPPPKYPPKLVKSRGG